MQDRGRLTKSEAKEALNFQRGLGSVVVAIRTVSSILTAVTFGIFALITPLLFLAVWVLDIVFSVQGFLKAKDGAGYRYPASIRLIK